VSSHVYARRDGSKNLQSRQAGGCSACAEEEVWDDLIAAGVKLPVRVPPPGPARLEYLLALLAQLKAEAAS
jgi:hypothetical protein